MTQRVLITAGADGIGLEIAKSFLKNNARVWVTDINQDAIIVLPDGILGCCLDVVWCISDMVGCSMELRGCSTELLSCISMVFGVFRGTGGCDFYTYPRTRGGQLGANGGWW